jgi:hypothetical protein
MPRRSVVKRTWAAPPCMGACGLQTLRAEPEPGAEPDGNLNGYGGAEPRLTSGGRADSHETLGPT